MTYNLTVWKWRTGMPPPRVDDVLEETYKDDAHPALTRFDRLAFEMALRDAFGDISSDESPLQCEMADFYGLPANWALISVSRSQIEDVFSAIGRNLPVSGLTMYDYESARVVTRLRRAGKWRGTKSHGGSSGNGPTPPAGPLCGRLGRGAYRKPLVE